MPLESYSGAELKDMHILNIDRYNQIALQKA